MNPSTNVSSELFDRSLSRVSLLTDAGVQCTDSSQCQSFCQAKEGSEINSESSGMCYGYEFRNFKTTKLNIPVYLLSGGMVLGKIMFTEIKENNTEWKYAWKIKVLKKLAKPWKYSHPQGAQRWVKRVYPR